MRIFALAYPFCTFRRTVEQIFASSCILNLQTGVSLYIHLRFDAVVANAAVTIFVRSYFGKIQLIRLVKLNDSEETHLIAFLAVLRLTMILIGFKFFCFSSTLWVEPVERFDITRIGQREPHLCTAEYVDGCIGIVRVSHQYLPFGVNLHVRACQSVELECPGYFLVSL